MMNELENPETEVSSNSPARLAFTTISGFFALGFGSGLSPAAPGTAGSLAAIPLALLLRELEWTHFGLFLCVAFLLGIYWCDKTSKRMDKSDPGAIVWDEIVAMWLVLAFVPASWPWWLAAFVLFRLFDIAKPWPIRWFDRKVKGGLGIMIDDIVAALYAIGLLLLARQFLPDSTMF